MGDKCIDDGLQPPFHHLIELMERKPDAVIR
jgi:hypothetical protein